mmetsp:Transcript_147907/g.359011  ORF Transcript_147907/g.359011 Transcript_147907/m.359011 type:complete len:249 (+) Transcript_147907:2278-3024(+)
MHPGFMEDSAAVAHYLHTPSWVHHMEEEADLLVRCHLLLQLLLTPLLLLLQIGCNRFRLLRHGLLSRTGLRLRPRSRRLGCPLLRRRWHGGGQALPGGQQPGALEGHADPAEVGAVARDLPVVQPARGPWDQLHLLHHCACTQFRPEHLRLQVSALPHHDPALVSTADDDPLVAGVPDLGQVPPLAPPPGRGVHVFERREAHAAGLAALPPGKPRRGRRLPGSRPPLAAIPPPNARARRGGAAEGGGT